MTTRHLLSRLILPLALLALTAAILSCAPVETGPRIWIDWPRDGHQVEAGTPLTVICHAYARDGLAEVQLTVNGEPYQLVAPAQAGEKFVEISLEWVATQPGDYLLSLTSFDMNGETSIPASVSVTVPGEAPGLILTPPMVTTPLTPTLEGPSVTPPAEIPTATTTPVTPTPTGTSTPTGTPRPPTATPPPPPPTIVSFEANPPSVELGQCTTLSWAAEGVISSVWLDEEGVGDHDSSQRCPQATTTYILRAVGPGGETTATLQVPVTEPPTHTPSPTPDTEGPPAPALVSPTGGVVLDCEPVTLDWNPVNDPSGIGTYYVKWEREVTEGNWQSLGGQATTATEVTISLGCGISYRWSVMAEDGAGNPGAWASWAEFGVTFG